jgi:hypothetical protein
MLEMVKASILEDIHNGVVPATLQTFADLHDHVDTNEYFLVDAGSMLGTMADYNAILWLVNACIASKHRDTNSRSQH